MAIENPSNNRRVLALIAGVLVFVVGLAGVVYFSRNSSNGSLPGTTSPSVQVVVSKVLIAKGQQLTVDNVKITTRSKDTVPKDYVPDVTTLVPSSSSGTAYYASVDISENTPVTMSLLSTNQQAAQLAGPPLPLASGNVALAIPVDDMKGVGGYIQPEDRIDILIDTNFAGHLNYAFQDIRVLRVGTAQPAASQAAAQSGSTPAPAPTTAPSLLVVELTRAQAEILAEEVACSSKCQDVATGKTLPPPIITYVLRAQKDFRTGIQSNGPLNVPNPEQDPGSDITSFDHLFGQNPIVPHG